MGYYTSYQLELITDGYEPSIIGDLRRENENAEYALSEDGSYGESCKWYDYEIEMTEFSKKYPDTIFILTGEGEESGDLWKCYFRDGKSQHIKARIVFDEPSAEFKEV